MNIFGPFIGWFSVATSVAVNGGGNLFVADFYNYRVQKFAEDATFLIAFGTRGGAPAGSITPSPSPCPTTARSSSPTSATT